MSAGDRRGAGQGSPFPTATGYRLVAHTSDFGIAGRGRRLEDLFRVMAEGLFALILEGGEVRSRVQRKIRLRASPAADLLHDWLQEINGLHQVHQEVYAGFTPVVHGDVLTAVLAGEPVDPGRHQIQHEVKGITWHDLELDRDELGWFAYVLVDV